MEKREPKHWSEKQGKNRVAFTAWATGLNDSLEFMGRQLHVQTENMGFPMAHIVTQVFCGGRVVLSRKSEYPTGVCKSHDSHKIEQLMKMQHHKVIQEIADKQAKIRSSH